MLASDVCVRQWKVAAVTCWFELSLLCGFLGPPFFAAFLAPPFFAAFFPPFLVAIASMCSFFQDFFGFVHDHKILCLLLSCGLE